MKGLKKFPVLIFNGYFLGYALNMRGWFGMVYPKIKLKAARVNAGMTQEDVAKALNRNKQTIVNWENGVTEIKVNDFKLLSELYDIPIDFLAVPEKSD